MADKRRPSRFRPIRSEPVALQPEAPTPPPVQATKDVVAVSTFVGRVHDARNQGQYAPTPRPMREVLGRFRGDPAAQTRIQVLAAAGAARHFHAESAQARRWEKLAQDNAVRQAQLEARQAEAGRSQEQIAANEKLIFDAAGAVALSYVAAKSLPPYEALADLSREHLADTELPQPEQVPANEAEVNEQDVVAADTHEVAEAAATEDADLSASLEEVTPPKPKSGNHVADITGALHSGSRGIGAAAGPIQGDDEVAPPLSPVRLNQVSEEILRAMREVMKAHPKSVTEMLNADRQPDHTNADVFVADMGAQREPELVVGY